jgi:tripartite-type tricarboxylate transporter receptor subunit TctC
VIAKLHADIVRTVNAPDVREKMTTLGFELVGNSPEEFAALIRNDIARFGKLVKAAGIKGSE